jgi:hypothetical protein
MTEMAKKKLLSEYQAAAVSGLSPELLRWLTKNAPKQGVSRKLKVAEVKGRHIFMNEEELLSFNSWLKSPWPQRRVAPELGTRIRRKGRTPPIQALEAPDS